jgi:hypothetical protein
MPRNLTAWDAIAEDGVRTLVVIGESNAHAQGVSIERSWPGRMRNKYSRWQSMGLGFRHFLRTDEWTRVGATRHASNVAYDKAPHRLGYRLVSSTDHWTYAVPTGHTAHSTSKLVYVDAPGAGDWSININGGGWQSAGAAVLGDNGVKTVNIGTTLTAGQTVAVRGANAAGTAAQCDILGIDVRNGNATGLLVHNLGASAHKLGGALEAGTIEPFVRDTTGDDLAILDYLDPDVCIVWFGSDAVYEDVTELRASLQEVITRVQGNGGQCLLPNYPELDDLGGFTVANQLDLRDAYLAESDENDTAWVDVFTPFGESNDAGAALGYFQGDKTHLSEKGHDKVAQLVWRVLGLTSRKRLVG